MATKKLKPHHEGEVFCMNGLHVGNDSNNKDLLAQ